MHQKLKYLLRACTMHTKNKTQTVMHDFMLTWSGAVNQFLKQLNLEEILRFLYGQIVSIPMQAKDFVL